MRSFSTWPAPLPGGATSDECALAFDQNRVHRLLILPALFDEANKLRRLTVEIMRRLDLSGIDSILPDLPGCNESPAALREQNLVSWKEATKACAKYFGATHVLTMRSGALFAPHDIPGWRYAPAGGQKLIRSMLRARTIASREAGQDETIGGLELRAKEAGITLAGWELGADMFAALSVAPTPATPTSAGYFDINQEMVGGGGLWLRAEPDEDHEQADAIAAIIAVGLAEA
ncbi:hypothetical protein GCM10023115_16160 [Pontixanthobacter gangjinensis]|uniref:Uncharacterized protein n=1 Tax=Pontixanthobacter gangjinensis TaxID=1028742 RepID=A0A6I4SMB3_9SPHN|nr:hypothetical protein [Pontixanthobacter gangjinensis]MXO56859.1 hypothetical protein [Pontixanthobacter gangjinensis]